MISISQKSTIQAYLMLLLVVSLAGCSTIGSDKKLSCKEPRVAPMDWVTISGSMLPTATFRIGECGLTLADVLATSRTLEKLEYQAELSSKPRSSSQSLKDIDAEQLLSIISKQKINSTNLETVVFEVETALQKYPDLSLVSQWEQGFPNYAFDKDFGSDYEKRLISLKVDALEPAFKPKAIEHLTVLLDANASEEDRKRSMEHLRNLASNGSLNVERAQKLKSWCFVQSRGVELKAVVSSFSALKVDQSVMGDVPAQDLLMVLVHRRAECVIVPLPLVFESAFGGYWIEPGDHIVLAKFQELPFAHFSEGEKRVGLTGMISTQGIWPTEHRSLDAVTNTFRDRVDLRGNMITITQATDRLLVRTMLPYNMVTLSPNRISQMRELIRLWGLSNGQVVEFQNTGTADLLLESTRKLRNATDAQRRTARKPILTCKEAQRTSCGEPTASTKSCVEEFKQQIPLLDGACETVQGGLQTVKDTLGNAVGL